MAVPAHDARDFEFAVKFGLPVECIMSPDPLEVAASGLDIEDVLKGRHAGPATGQ